MKMNWPFTLLLITFALSGHRKSPRESELQD